MTLSDKIIHMDDIDAGKGFDWGKTSKDYAQFRDVYPEEFYHYILNLSLFQGTDAEHHPSCL